MNNDQLLQQFVQAVSDVLEEKLDAKLKAELQPIRADIQEMKLDIRKLKFDVEELKNDVEVLKTDVEELKADVEELKTKVDSLERRVTSVELHIENKTDKHIQIVAENHINLSKKLDEAIPAVNKQGVYELKVDYLIKKVDKLEMDVAELQEKMA